MISSLVMSTFGRRSTLLQKYGHTIIGNRTYVQFVPDAKPKGLGFIKDTAYWRNKYGGWIAATLIPGHGIGPEQSKNVVELFEVLGCPCYFMLADADYKNENNDDLYDVVCSIQRNGVGLKGNIETRSNDPKIISRNVYLRNTLDLYVYVMHCHTFHGVKSIFKDVNIFVIRQNIEAEYSSKEHEVIPGVVDSLKITSQKNTERIARFAFNFAKKTGRKKITTIHKANIMKLSDGLFLDVAREMAKEYPEIEHDDMIIDNCCMQLVTNPYQFDVMLTPNLYGTIVTNVLCGLTGGVGLFSGCNYGDEYAVFEPGARNSGSAIVGKNIANPIAMINASVDLLRYLGLETHSKILQAAIDNTINVEKVHTKDLGGPATTKDVMESLYAYIRKHQIKTFQQN